MRTGPATWKEYDVVRSQEDENSFGFHGKLGDENHFLVAFRYILSAIYILMIFYNNKT